MRREVGAERERGGIVLPKRPQVGFERWRLPPSNQVAAAVGPSADGLHSDFRRTVEAVEPRQRLAAGAEREGCRS